MQSQLSSINSLRSNRWLNENNLFLLACLLCGLPVWLPHFPPMADLPQHAAQISIFLNLDNPNFPFSEQFQHNFFTPYLLGYFLVAIVTPLLGIVAACKLVIWIALAAFAHSTRFLLRQTGADPYWAWLTFPVLFGFSYQWGLLNFLIAAPVGIYFLGLVWRQVDKYDWRSSLLIAVMLYALFFSHALVMALFVLITSAYWLFSVRKVSDFIKLSWPLITLAPVVLVWFALTSQHPQANSFTEWDLSWVNTTDGYYKYFANWANATEPGWGRLTGFIPRLLGERPSLLITLFGIFLFALPFLTGGKLTKTRKRWIPAIIIILIVLFLPSVLRGNSYTFQRFTYLVMPLFLIALDASIHPGCIQQYLRRLLPLIAFGWIAFMSFNALQFNKDSAGFDTVLKNMEPHKRAISLIFSRDDSHSIAPTLLHYPAWYSATKSGLTYPSFAIFYGMPLTFKPNFLLSQDYVWSPKRFDWKIHQGHTYDYFLVRAPIDASSVVFRTAQCRIRLVTQSGLWWLYERDPAC